MFILTDLGTLVNLAHVECVYLQASDAGTVVIMADGNPISGPMTAEEGRAGLGHILSQQQELAGTKPDKQFERRIQKEQAEIIARAANDVYHSMVRYHEWRCRRTWYYRLWSRLTTLYYRIRSNRRRSLKTVQGI